MESALKVVVTILGRIGVPDRLNAIAARMLVAGSLTLAAAASAAAAIGCSVAALWIFAQPLAGAAGAALVAAGALLFLCVVLLIVSRRATRRRRPEPSTAAADALFADAVRLIQEGNSVSLMAAFAAGLAAGHRSRER